MSSVIYSGGTIVNTTFTCTTGTRAEIVTGLGAALVSAGWTSIGSGVYESATTAAPKSNFIRVKLNDPGSGNCAQVRIEDVGAVRASNYFWLLPAAGKVYRVIACKYNFFCFTAIPTASREFLAAGTLHIPAFLEGVTNGALGWIQANSNNDADTTVRDSWRTVLNSGGSGQSPSWIRNNVAVNLSSAFGLYLNSAHAPGATFATAIGYRWADGSLCTSEAIVSFGNAASGDEPRRQGILHNAMMVSESYPGDDITITSYDGHAWYGVTVTNAGSGSQYIRGTLFLAIT